jgi:hypothetical protein
VGSEDGYKLSSDEDCDEPLTIYATTNNSAVGDIVAPPAITREMSFQHNINEARVVNHYLSSVNVQHRDKIIS